MDNANTKFKELDKARKVLPETENKLSIKLDNIQSKVTAKEENIKATEHATQYDTNWFYDPVLKGEYPEYVVKQLVENGWTPDWTKEELSVIKETAEKNDFIGLNLSLFSLISVLNVFILLYIKYLNLIIILDIKNKNTNGFQFPKKKRFS